MNCWRFVKNKRIINTKFQEAFEYERQYGKYDEANAELAWQRTIDFFNEKLT